MEAKTKVILSFLGIAAIIIPAILLLTLSRKPQQIPPVQSDLRNIDSGKVVSVSPSPLPSPIPSPIPTTTLSPIVLPIVTPSPLVSPIP